MTVRSTSTTYGTLMNVNGLFADDETRKKSSSFLFGEQYKVQNTTFHYWQSKPSDVDNNDGSETAALDLSLDCTSRPCAFMTAIVAKGFADSNMKSLARQLCLRTDP